MSKVQIRLLQTSDVHGYIYPRSYATLQPENIGIAKISSLIKEYRTNNTVVIDTGDTIQGSPLTYYFSKNEIGKHPMVDVMNHINYDFVTIGNHEFNYGREYLDGYLTNVSATILNSNILKDGVPLYGVPYSIKVIDGVKIGFVGVTTHYIPNWEQPSVIEDLEFRDAFEALQETVNNVRPNVDLLVVSYHGGFERDLETGLLNVDDTGENQGYKMISEIDGIDIFLSGHQHRTLASKLNNTYYVQPSFNGTGLGMIDIEFDLDSNTFEVPFIEVLDTVGAVVDQEILSLVQDIEDKANTFLDIPVGTTSMDLLIVDQMDARINKHPIISLINQVQMEFTGAQVSLCSLGNNVSGFNKKITIRDLISTYIYPNVLVVKEVTGKALLQGLEKTAEFFVLKDNKIVVNDAFRTPKVQMYAYDMYDGVSYTINLQNPLGERISDVLVADVPLDITETYSLAMNNYRASGGGDYPFYKNSKTLNDTQTEIIELLIEYLYKEKDLVINHKKNIKIVY